MAGPLQVKTVTLSYSKAKDIAGLLRSKISTRGEIVIDDRTNTLIISEVRDKLDLLEKLLSVLDTPTPQVSIEARIIEATSTFIHNLGIQWGYQGIVDPFYGNQTSLTFPHKILADGAMIPQGIVTKGIGGPLGGYAINLPAPPSTLSPASPSPIFWTPSGSMLPSPRWKHREMAGLYQVRKLQPRTTSRPRSSRGARSRSRQWPISTVTTRFVNAALELRATPQITAEGTIIMMVELQNNAADFANLVNGIPPITTQSAKTTVMVPDGGRRPSSEGLPDERSVTRDSVPFLGKIPILGNLFRNMARTKQNRELLIFITPRIIK